MRKISYIVGIVFCLIALILGWRILRPEAVSHVHVMWDSMQTPAIEAEVNGKKCLLNLFTSSKSFLNLNEQGMKYLTNTEPQGTAIWRDRLGTSREKSLYTVKNLIVCGMKFSNVIAGDKNTQDDQGGIIWNNPFADKDLWPKVSGGIGRPILKETNLLLDLGRDTIIATNSKYGLEKEGFSLDSMNKIAFEPDERDIIVRMNTAMGVLRFDINTGATVSFIRSSLVSEEFKMSEKMRKDSKDLSYFLTNLSIGKTEFGEQRLYLVDICDDLNWIDGSIGIDFLKSHVVYIDYQNKFVYIR